MIVPFYESGKSIIIATHYKGGKSMMTSLIILKIRVMSHVLDHMLNHVLDHMLDYIIIGLDQDITIAFFFGMSSKKYVIVKKLFATR